jgi:hypothetical protein
LLIGAADTQRGSGSASQRPPQPADQHLRRSLIRGLGRSTFDEAHAQGRSLFPHDGPPAHILHANRELQLPMTCS